MNKRMKFALVAVLAVVTAALTGCGKKDTPATTAATEEAPATITTELQQETVATELQQEAVTTAPQQETETQQANNGGAILEDWDEEEDEPTETEPSETKPAENPTESQPTEKPADPKPVKPAQGGSAYEKYLHMSPAEQQKFYESFESVDAYFAWLNNAKAEYEKNQNSTELEGGSVDLGDLVGGK